MEKKEVKLVKLTTEESETLYKFIGKAVMANASFPSNTIGMQNITVQDLVNNRTIETLKNYGKFINKTYNNNDEMFDEPEKEGTTFNGITVQELLSFLVLIIKHKKYIIDKEILDKKISKIKSELEKHKTPEERKAELNAMLNELTKE